MGLGASIFLIAAGAILAFAVDYQLWWFDIAIAGWILMGVGVLGLVVTPLWSRRGRDGYPPSRPDYYQRPGPPP